LLENVQNSLLQPITLPGTKVGTPRCARLYKKAKSYAGFTWLSGRSNRKNVCTDHEMEVLMYSMEHIRPLSKLIW